MDLYGSLLSGEELRRRVGHLSQVGGVRLLASDNGPSRGVRLVEFRTGTGLSFEIGVERGFDVGRADYRGASLGWMPPTLMPGPGTSRTRRISAGSAPASAASTTPAA
jgi:hypothetical protein